MAGAIVSAVLRRVDHEHAAAADLASAVEQALLQTHRPELASVRVDVCAGRVHLRGRVSSFHALQCALAAVQRVDGVSTICSLIEVRSVPEAPGLSRGSKSLDESSRPRHGSHAH